MEMFECIHCKKQKVKELFCKDSRKPLGIILVCKCCYNRLRRPSIKASKEKQKLRYATDSVYREMRKAQTHQYRTEHKANVMLGQAKTRALKFNLEFDLVLEDVVIPEVCPILGIPLYHGNKKRMHNSPSIDRVDNSKGYTKDNIRVISYLANHMKANATREQLEAFAKNIIPYLNGDDIVRAVPNLKVQK